MQCNGWSMKARSEHVMVCLHSLDALTVQTSRSSVKVDKLSQTMSLGQQNSRSKTVHFSIRRFVQISWGCIGGCWGLEACKCSFFGVSVFLEGCACHGDSRSHTMAGDVRPPSDKTLWLHPASCSRLGVARNRKQDAGLAPPLNPTNPNAPQH